MLDTRKIQTFQSDREAIGAAFKLSEELEYTDRIDFKGNMQGA